MGWAALEATEQISNFRYIQNISSRDTKQIKEVSIHCPFFLKKIMITHQTHLFPIIEKLPEKLWEELVNWDLSSIGGAGHTQRSVTWSKTLKRMVLEGRGQKNFECKIFCFLLSWSEIVILATCLWRTRATLSEGLAPFPLLDFGGWKHQRNQKKI